MLSCLLRQSARMVWNAAAFDEWEAGNDSRFAELQEEVLPGVL